MQAHASASNAAATLRGRGRDVGPDGHGLGVIGGDPTASAGPVRDYAAMRILALDTATPATAVALQLGGGEPLRRRHEPAADERPGHATQVLALALELLDEAGIDWPALDRIAVGTGPGTFTGVRIGVATARALAQAHGLELVGVSTLRALALAAAPDADGQLVAAVLDARRGEAFAAAWSADGELLLEPAALTPDALERAVGALPTTPLAVGDGAVKFRERLEAAGAAVPADESALHRVDAVAHCRLAATMEPSARDAVLPTYLRLPDAELALRRRREDRQ
jgi:tRNA threonylcarbamoyladenosine biosynthesis protein TsaB